MGQCEGRLMNKRELLFSITKKDFVINWFSGKGAGGQHRNKHMNCCRIKHSESGVIVVGQDQRSQKANLKSAFSRMVNHLKFKTWLRIKASEVAYGEDKLRKKLDDLIADSMNEKNLKIEYLERL